WWSSILLMVVGIYGLCVPNSFIIQQSFIDGFLKFFLFDVWQWLFIVFGLFQFTALRCESIIGRGVAAFFCVLFINLGNVECCFLRSMAFQLGRVGNICSD
ncbi:unnamed protein product, partial [Commensalibacter communis]